MSTIKQLLQQYAAYNRWAHQKLFDVILALSAEKFTEEVPSSFSSLYQTCFHIWDAESIWWQRLKLQENISMPSKTMECTMQEVMDGLAAQSKQWEEWINNATDLALDHEFIYRRFNKQQVKQPVWQMILHVMNHGTYHRGQIVNMLRQLGVEKIPSTDFSTWATGKR